MKKFSKLTILLLAITFLSGCADTVTPTTTQVSPTATSATTSAVAPTLVVTPTETVEAVVIPNTVPPIPTITPRVGFGTNYMGRLAYDRLDAGSFNVFTLNPNGTDAPFQLVGGRGPAYSPTGNLIAFYTLTQDSKGTTLKINTVNPNRTLARTHCSLQTAANVGQTITGWSPENSFISLASRDQGTGKLSMCNFESNQFTTPLQYPQGRVDGIYTWSTDGKYAIWQAGTSDNDFNLYYGDVAKAGAEAVKLTTGQNRLSATGGAYQYYGAARFSPDNKTIAVGGTKLFLLSVPNQQSPFANKEFDLPNISSLAFSPDGKALAVVSNGKLLVLDLATGKSNELDHDVTNVDWK